MLNDKVFSTLKQEAARAGRSFKNHLNGILEWTLKERKKQRRFQLKWKTMRGRCPPAVDVADRDRLYDFLDKTP